VQKPPEGSAPAKSHVTASNCGTCSHEAPN
jgi:hypothetical protein